MIGKQAPMEIILQINIVTYVVTESITDITEENSDEIYEAKEVNEDVHRLEEEILLCATS